MALDINGYNAAFKAFADFATQSVETGKFKAVARASADVETGPLAGRTVTASTTDKVGKFFRSNDDQRANDATRTLFKNAIIDMFGGESKIPENVKDAMRLADYGKGKPLTARRIMAVKAAIDANTIQNTIQKTVEGSGKAADILKGIMRRKLDGASDPAKQLDSSLRANANAMMNWSLCAEMKKNGVNTQFEKDITRGTDATLTDGKTTIKLTNDFETARDELAQFVTGDSKATYGGLASEDRCKVHMLMSLISQETEKAGEDGTRNALSSREDEGAFEMSGFNEFDKAQGKGGDAVRTYLIEKRADGGIDLHYTMDKPIKDIDDGNTDGDGYALGEGSKFTCKMDYSLKGAEFNRLANLDYDKFDGSEAYKIFNSRVDLPDGTRGYQDHKLERVVDSFAQDFKVDADCKMVFKLTLNPSEEE